MSFRFTEAASRDLEDIAFYGIAEFGLEQAQNYHSRLMHSCHFLSENPLAARLRTEVRPPVRAFPVKSHVIVYEIDDANKVLVIRVLHANDNWLDL